MRESKALNKMPGPRVVISASGMLTAGRVLHHLRRLLPNKRNLVMLVGYQAQGTRGRAMMEGADTIKIHGKKVPVRAEFMALSGLSAHADRNELLSWVKAMGRRPSQAFVVHGEPKPAEAIADALTELGVAETTVPHRGEQYQF